MLVISVNGSNGGGANADMPFATSCRHPAYVALLLSRGTVADMAVADFFDAQDGQPQQVRCESARRQSDAHTDTAACRPLPVQGMFAVLIM